MKQVLELYGLSTLSENANWESIFGLQNCPFCRQPLFENPKEPTRCNNWNLQCVIWP